MRAPTLLPLLAALAAPALAGASRIVLELPDPRLEHVMSYVPIAPGGELVELEPVPCFPLKGWVLAPGPADTVVQAFLLDCPADTTLVEGLLRDYERAEWTAVAKGTIGAEYAGLFTPGRLIEAPVNEAGRFIFRPIDLTRFPEVTYVSVIDASGTLGRHVQIREAAP